MLASDAPQPAFTIQLCNVSKHKIASKLLGGRDAATAQRHDQLVPHYFNHPLDTRLPERSQTAYAGSANTDRLGTIASLESVRRPSEIRRPRKPGFSSRQRRRLPAVCPPFT